MKITVNGAPAEADADPDLPAAHLLRDRLDLTGTKVACGTGVCGACTVLVDGTPMASCLLPSAALREREVTTVEGLGGDHPVQRAFAAEDALQCGYCTPGFVVEAAAFVDRHRAEHGDVAPDRRAIADAMAGHLCRCGAYEGVYRAIAAACEGRYDDDPGTPARVDAPDKVTGRARYTTDVRLDGQLEGVIVRADRPHARVLAVAFDGEAALVDLLPEDRVVRYAGQPIAAVAAATYDEACAAAARVRVRYADLPATTRPTGEGRPIYAEKDRKNVHNASEGFSMPGKWRGNMRGPASLLSWRGGAAVRRIAAAAERGDPRLVTGEYGTAVQVHTPLEPHACVARWDERGDLHLYLSTQAIGMVAERAAARWGLRPEQVHIVADHVGGAFGAKVQLGVEAIAAAELARAAGAPVRVVFSRAEELTDAGNRPGTTTRIAMLAGADGELKALTMDTRADGGAAIGSVVAGLARLMYGTAPRRLRDYDMLTNLPPGSPFRAPGGPPMAWALEQTVDEMAHRLGEDPIALRRRWDGNRRRRVLYEWAAELPVWRERAPSGSRTGRFRRGVGVAAAAWLYALTTNAQVELTVEGGVVVARSTTQDIGTGTRSVIAEVLREELGLPEDKIRVEIGRSGTVSGPPSLGSRATTSVGPAARDAGRKLRDALGPEFAERPEKRLVDAEGLRVVGERARDRGGYLVPISMHGVGVGRGLSGAVQVTEVEVDTRLGVIRPLRVWAGIAAGRIYRERLARSQCEGGVIQGIGYALYEERQFDPETGHVLTANLEDYRIPGIGDTPEITVRFLEEGWDHVTGGGIGLAEVSTIGVAASVGNAVYNATGWRPRHLPIRPDRLLQGLKGLEGMGS
ncbi:molybdopterin-dependent oxidoreductase [Thermopolyspora sp. NPDC052614]|uniref:molybdopterin-dependent oxidoreductase n=1 Tax=Thermopolyspora sp. NPDC052614 TaxID=3155682 RepID=UPI0034294E7D